MLYLVCVIFNTTKNSENKHMTLCVPYMKEPHILCFILFLS